MSKEKRDKKINTFGLKILSVVIAFVIWIAVYNLADGITSDTKTVKINIKNEDVMSDMKLSYDLNGNDTVKVRYKIRSNERGKINTNDFDAYIDFSEYTVTEAFPIHCNILNGKDVLFYDISLEPSIIKIDTEKIQKKTFNIESILNGEPRNNYSIGGIILGDKEVEVEGPQSELGRINKVGIELDIKDIHEDKSGRQKIVYYDSNDNKLKLSSKMKTSIDSTKYDIDMLYRKNVDVEVDIVGEPIEYVYYKSHEIIPRDITIEGDIETIENINKINIGTVDITGKTDDYTYNLDIENKMPEGINLISDKNIRVDIKFIRVEPETVVETTEAPVESTEEISNEEKESDGTEENMEESTDDSNEHQSDAEDGINNSNNDIPENDIS